MKLEYNVAPPPKHKRISGFGATATVLEFYNSGSPYAEVVCHKPKSAQTMVSNAIKERGLREYLCTRRVDGRLYLIRKDLFVEGK